MSQDLLARLVLYRNDPDLAEEIRQAAEAGLVDAQYAMGLLYAEGRGVEHDPVAAYIWLSRAVEQGDRDAEALRHIVLQQMTQTQIAEAERQLAGATWQ
jgi:TPR repeat protein